MTEEGEVVEPEWKKVLKDVLVYGLLGVFLFYGLSLGNGLERAAKKFELQQEQLAYMANLYDREEGSCVVEESKY